MADKRISQLGSPLGRNSKVDFLPILDTDASETKKIQVKNLSLTVPQKQSLYPYTTDFQGAVNAAGTKQTRNITGLGAGAGQVNFVNSGNLRSIYIGSNVTAVETGCFLNATGLTNASLAVGMSSIPRKTFRNCGNLTSITIPDSVTSIGDQAFFDCAALSDITIPDGVTTFGSEAFYGCLNISDNLTFDTPDKLISIGTQCFYACTFHGINLNSNLTTIHNAAFIRSHITGITIPSGVISIGANAFYECGHFSGMNCNIPLTSIGTDAFTGTNINLVIHARASDSTWTAGTNQNILGNSSVDVIKDL